MTCLLTTTMHCKASERCSQAEGKPGVKIVLVLSLGRFANVCSPVQWAMLYQVIDKVFAPCSQAS